MPNAVTTEVKIAPEFPAAHYRTQAFIELAKKYIFYKHAMKEPLPKGNGKTVQFRKHKVYTPTTTALTEGTPPTQLTPEVGEVLVTIAQYGDYTGISDLASFTAIDNLVSVEVDKLTRLQHEKVELLNVEALKLASNVIYAANASGTVATAVADLTPAHLLTSTELRKAVRDLKKRNASPFYRNGKPYFIAFVNPDSTFALQDDKAWRDVSVYQDSEKIENGEIGKLFGCIVIESPFAVQWDGVGASGANVQGAIVVGAYAYGNVELEGERNFSVYANESGGPTDPLHQKRTVGVKIAGFAAKIIDQSQIVCIKHGVAA